MYNYKYSTFFLFFISFLNTSLSAQDVKIMKLPTSDVVYVPQKDKVYATHYSLRDFGKCYLYRINPYLGIVEETKQIGYQINKLAVSDDGQYLYMAEYGNRIYRYNLSTNKVDLTINLGIQTARPDSFITLQIRVMPQKNNTIAIVRGTYSGADYPEDVAIYEDDRLVATSERNTDFGTIAFSKNTDYIYTSTIFGKSFFVLQRRDNKLETIKWYPDIVGLDGKLKADDDGYLYTQSGGLRIDVKNIIPVFEGHFKPRPVISGGHPYVSPPQYQTEPNSNFMYTLSDEYLQTGSQSYLSKFTKDNYLISSKKPLALNPDFTYFRNLIRFGSGNLLATNLNEVIIIRDCTPSVSTPPMITQGAKITLCRDSFITLSATSGYANYFWTTGDTGQTIKIPYSVTNPPLSAISVSVSQQEKACMSNYSNPISIETEHSVPKPQIANEEFNTDITICQGDSVILRSLTSGIKGLIWSTGAISDQIVVKTTGKYAAKAISLAGCIGQSSDSVKINVRPEPAPPRPPITLVGDSILCLGEQATLKTTTGYVTYEWTNSGINSAQIVVNPYQTTPYKVRVTDNIGCKSGWSAITTIGTITVPNRPFITANGKLLAINTVAERYQWFLNDVPINGATTSFYTATTVGKYTVQAFNGRCSSPISNAVTIVF